MTMNKKFNENTPRFKTIDDQKNPSKHSRNPQSFQGEGRQERKFQPKSDRLSGRESARRYPQGSQQHSTKQDTPYSQKPNYAIYPSEAKKVGGEGAVHISVKGGRSLEKKTGPLSPRAPEKIRNNRATEMKVYGENACYSVFQQRPEAIVRLWATVEGAKKSGELLSYLAEQKKAYHVVDSQEMERVTGTEHHGGLCLLVKKSPPFSLEGYLQIARQRDCLVLLDGVNNAQNIGGIIRTCAFYGVKGIIVESHDLLNSSSAARVAEGGLEFVHSLETKHKQIALTQLRKAGYQIVHLTRQKQTKALSQVALNAKVVFVLSEVVLNEIEYPEDTAVQLSFSNPLNSGLNVAVNAGILLAQWYHAHII